MTMPEATARVLDELKVSPAWRDAERRAAERETAERQRLIDELAALRKAREEEWPRLAEAVAAADRKVEAARVALAAAEAEHADRWHEENLAATAFDSAEGRLLAALVASAAPLVARAERAIDEAVEAARGRFWLVEKEPDFSTGYFPLNASNAEAVQGAIDRLLALRSRPSAIAAEVADLASLEVRLRELELEAGEVVSAIAPRPEEGWVQSIVNRIFGAAS